MTPPDWGVAQIDSLYEKLDTGKLFDQKTSFAYGRVPVLAQSADGYVGFHDENPGVEASVATPVVTFANHTCEMRVMRRPFSVIQNIFPMIGRSGVCDTVFFYYATKGRVYLEEYKGHYPDYRRLWISLPPIPTQRAIANVLGTLDDLIELNRETNQILEEMVRALFKSWFVDFDPVRAKLEGRPPAGMDAETAALSPDHFEDSELGQIPRGWEVKPLGDEIELVYGKPLKAEDRVPGPIQVYGSNGPVGWHEAKLVSGPGIVVGRKGNPGIVTWSNEDFYPIDTTFYVKPIGHCQSLFFLFHALSHQNLENLSADSAVPGLNRNHAYMSKQLIPPAPILSAFDKQVAPMSAIVHANHAESRELAALRDTLLPKLLSGEVSVPEAEELVASST